MAIVENVKRDKLIRKEATVAWRWLIHLSEYKADYNRQPEELKSSKHMANEVGINLKYGFYPLINPNCKERVPNDFVIAFSRMLKQQVFDWGVEFENPSLVDLKILESPKDLKRLKRKNAYQEFRLPDKAIIKVDPKKPIGFVIVQIKDYLRRLRKAYKIKNEKPRLASLNLTYQYYVLENLGVKRKEIRKKIAPFIGRDEDNESQRKKAYRISKKVKSIRTQK
ncbi:MAG: hypothetical protein NTZ92_05375 [Candidatus Omnitrophica bacterium]|nr:hypothetical protein [Candidatus Omnitrophota bacterium]